jgi:hypothetical protein
MMLVTLLMAIHSQEGSLWQCMHWQQHGHATMEPAGAWSLAPVKLMSTRDAPGGSQSLALQQHVGTWVGTACLQYLQ